MGLEDAQGGLFSFFFWPPCRETDGEMTANTTEVRGWERKAHDVQFTREKLAWEGVGIAALKRNYGKWGLSPRNAEREASLTATTNEHYEESARSCCNNATKR